MILGRQFPQRIANEYRHKNCVDKFAELGLDLRAWKCDEFLLSRHRLLCLKKQNESRN